MFKLAFHTYEALSNKVKLAKKISENQQNMKASNPRTRKMPDIKPEDDFDLVSNMSGESTYTVAGAAGPVLDKKLKAFNESYDVKLNNYLKKW